MPAHANVFDEIQAVCREFRRRLKDGEAPRIEAYLPRVDPSSEEMLFQNLLHLELQFRGRNGRPPSSDEYVTRFPRLARVVRQAFFESTCLSQAEVVTPADVPMPYDGTPDDYRTVLFDAPAARKLGEYELLRQIGRGGFGAVYKARHLHRGDIVALKLLPVQNDGRAQPLLGDADRLHRFRREFRSLVDVNHPNLIGMQALECDGSQWFFTMDLVEGTDFLDYVRPAGTLDEFRLRDALRQLVEGVIALHRRQIVHRDLKPSNVMVDRGGRVIILDFGLVVEQQRPSDRTVTMSAARFAGTPRYAAPEQMAGEFSPASDWYAVGTMLFEALTGDAPFPGPHPMTRKQEHDAAALSGSDEIPEDLAALTDALLRRSSSARPDELAIARALRLDLVSASAGSTDSGTGTLTYGTARTLVGRELQLAQLNAALSELDATRSPVVVFLSGRSGEGKTCLAEEFLSPLRMGADVVVLSGRCYDRESVPFKAIDALIDSLVAYLKSRAAEEVLARLPEDVHLLAHLFPTLRRVPSIADRATASISHIDDRQLRYRAFHALRELLVTIGRSTPVVLFVDDLQWGDGDSAGVLFELLAPPDPPPVLLLGSYRSDEAAESAFLQEWGRLSGERSKCFDARLVTVEPLNEEQCLALVAARVGLEVAQLRQQAASLFENTRGNPYFLEQLAEGFDADTRRFTAVPLEEVIDRKLARLPAESAPLLEVIAVAGQAVALEEACRAAGFENPTFSAVTRMRNERLLRLISSRDDSLVDTYHDKIRETVLGRLPLPTRMELHRRLAETIESGEGLSAAALLERLSRRSVGDEDARQTVARAFDLAHHYFEAGDPRAFVYQLLAGEQALQAYALEDAIVYYERADALLPGNASRSLRFRLFHAMGRVFLWNKDPDRALGCYRSASEEAEDDNRRARASAGIGAVYNQVARFDQAIEHYDEALRLLGAPRAKTRIGKLGSLVAKTARVLIVPARWQRASSERERVRAVLRHEALVRMPYFLVEKNVAATFDAILAGSHAAFRTGGPSLVAHGYAQAAEVFSAFGLGWVGNLLLRRSSRIGAELNDPDSWGTLLFSRGIAAYWGGDLRAAESVLEQALPLLRRCGNLYTRLICAHMIRHVRAFRGSSSAELSAARDVLELAREVGNAQCICWGEYDSASALARRGDLAEARAHMVRAYAELAGERYHMTEAIRGGTGAYVALQCSDYKTARELATAAWETAIGNLNVMDVTMLCLPLLIESIAGPNWKESSRTEDRSVLRRLLRRAAVIYLSFGNHRPHLQRVGGRAEWALGRKRRAIRRFEKAIRLAREKGMDYQCARSLLDLAAVKDEGRERNRGEAIELLRKTESVIPHAESWLLGEEYDGTVVAYDVGSTT